MATVMDSFLLGLRGVLSGGFCRIRDVVKWENLVLLQGQKQGMDRDLRSFGLLGNSDIFITTILLNPG